MAKKKAKHPGKVGKVGPKMKPEREKRMQIRFNFNVGEVEDCGGEPAVKEKLYEAFHAIKKVNHD